MGSWSETCFVTNLPIHEGGCRIVAIPVITTEWPAGLRFRRSGLIPVGPPVRGVYDTYGGIDIDEEELPLLEPLIEEIKRVNATLSYAKKDSERGSLSGIGLEEFHRELHLGEELPPDKVGSYEGASTTRTHVSCGDSAWLQFPVEVFPEDVDGDQEDLYLHVSWCFMLEEVYDHLISYPYGEGFYQNDAESIRASIDEYFDSFEDDEDDDLKNVSPEDLSGFSPEFVERFFKYSFAELRRLDNFFSRWVSDTTRVTSFDHPGIYPYRDKDVSPAIRDRFFEFMGLLHEFYLHRIVLTKSTGSQFGQWRRHQKLHTLCGKIVREQIKQYKIDNHTPYKDEY